MAQIDTSTREGRRSFLTDVWASWSYAGFVPTARDRELARLYIEGEVTADELVEIVKRDAADSRAASEKVQGVSDGAGVVP